MKIENNNLPIMVTIPQAASLCSENCIGISAYQIRRLCKERRVPCYKVGVKTLINWNGFLAFLENPSDSEGQNAVSIRPLAEGISKGAN